MHIDTDELDYIVRKILATYPNEKRWPINIIEEVFATIEQSKYVYLPQYKRMIGKNEEHKHAVNPVIGKLVKERTGLETLREAVPAKRTTLIETYTELGSKVNGSD